ncbi:MAG: hypothetical protein O2923_03590 [Verrucomicrobia bacterium]|nr:hypothetical protein [Verrucomicrobiota bacterium]MDA1086801.1 hypothetical protein [Verrucomicrobiota bacterium]
MTCPPECEAFGRTSKPSGSPWSRAQIQAARRADLPELLRAKGFALQELNAGNFRIREHPHILVRDCFWRSTDDERAGNAIDLFIYVLGMSFAQAMQQINPPASAPPRAS